MAIEFQVTLEDKPGELARLGAALGDADVNIDAIHGFSLAGRGIVQLVPNQPEQASKALEARGITFTQREVLVVKVLDESGMLGDVALVMSEAGINIDSVYITTAGHVVMAVDDLNGAIQVAGGMAVMSPE